MEHLPIYKRNKEIKNIRNIDNTNVLFVEEEPEITKKSNEYQPILDAWNALPLPSIRAIQGARLKMLQARIKEYSFDDVLQAITTAFTHFCLKNSRIFVAKPISSSFVLLPYGIFFKSPKYIVFSFGRTFRNTE